MELAWFLRVANTVGLDPLRKQIYFIRRQGWPTFQTGIDGFRCTAHATQSFAGLDEVAFNGSDSQYDCIMMGHVRPITASCTVYKLVQGHRVPFTATAGWDEYYPGDGPIGTMWRKMPYGQLGKCAESKALRMAFPDNLSGLYTDVEMEQSDARGRHDMTEHEPAKTQSRSQRTAQKLATKNEEPSARAEQHEAQYEDVEVIEEEAEVIVKGDGYLPSDQVRELNIAAGDAQLKDPARIPAMIRIVGRSIQSTKELMPEDYTLVMDVLMTARKLANRSKQRMATAWVFLAENKQRITSVTVTEAFNNTSSAQSNGTTQNVSDRTGGNRSGN